MQTLGSFASKQLASDLHEIASDLRTSFGGSASNSFGFLSASLIAFLAVFWFGIWMVGIFRAEYFRFKAIQRQPVNRPIRPMEEDGSPPARSTAIDIAGSSTNDRSRPRARAYPAPMRMALRTTRETAYRRPEQNASSAANIEEIEWL